MKLYNLKMHMHAIVPNQRTSDLAISYVIFFRVENNKVGLNCHRLIPHNNLETVTMFFTNI